MKKFLSLLASFLSFFRSLFTQLDRVFLKRVTISAFQNIIRNPIVSLSSVFILVLMVILVHITIAMKFFSEESLIALNKKVDLIVEVQDGVDFYQVEGVVTKIKNLEGVDSVKYVDKTQALVTFLGRHPNIRSFLAKYKLENPLPSTIEVVTTQAEQLKSVITILKQPQYKDLIAQADLDLDVDQNVRIEKLVALGNFVNSVSIGFLVLFLVVVVFVVFNTVNVAIHHRREEIQTMHLVGATKLFIQAPFVLEGIFYSLIALAIASIINVGLHLQIYAVVQNTLAQTSLLAGTKQILASFFYQYPQVILLEGMLLVGSSFVASFIAIEVYLKKHHI